MNVTSCVASSPDALQQALTVAGNAWLVKEWGTWVAGGAAYKAFKYADSVANLEELVEAFNAVEKLLADAEHDVHIKTHLPAFLEACQERLTSVEERLMVLQMTCAQSSRLAHLLTFNSAFAKDVRKQREYLSTIESELKRSSVRAKHLARTASAPLTPEQQIAEVKNMRPSTLPSIESLQSWNPLPAVLNPFNAWGNRIHNLADNLAVLEEGVGQPSHGTTVNLDAGAWASQALDLELATLDASVSAIPNSSSARGEDGSGQVTRCSSPLPVGEDRVHIDTQRSRILRKDLEDRLQRLKDMSRATV